MSELILRAANIPDTIEDLSRFVLIGREKLIAVKAEIRAIEKLHTAQEVREQKRAEAKMIGEAVLDAEVKLGELFKEIPTQQGKRTDLELADSTGGKSQTKKEIISNLGFSEKQGERLETLADNPDIVEYVKAEARENDDIPTRARVLELASNKNPNTALDKYSKFMDLRAKVYKDLMKIIDLTVRYETSGSNMDALRNNFDGVLVLEEHIAYINDAIAKLNLIKSEIWRAKKHERK